MDVIATIHTDYPEKFGIPKQSGIVADSVGVIRFCGRYNVNDAVKGLENYDYIWLLWRFDGFSDEKFSPMVRPPVLGGNTYVGVFATRSPNRPNHIGMSSVKLEKVEMTDEGPVLTVRGADLRDGTAIYDIKPYIPRDVHTDARHGFATDGGHSSLDVKDENHILENMTGKYADTIRDILKNDPRPAYHNDENRVYGVRYAEYNVRFTVKDNCLTVVGAEIFSENKI